MGKFAQPFSMKLGFLVLISTVNLFVAAKKKPCTTHAAMAALPDLTADWLDLHPYMYSTAAADGTKRDEPRGVFLELLNQLNESLPLTIRLGRRYDNGERAKFMNASLTAPPRGEGLILLPVTSKKKESSDACSIPDVYHTKGSIYIVKRNVKKPLEQLGNSFVNGGQIIAMTLVLSIISGVFIWILDRNRNPTDFPPSFVAGSWQGFWWAFVTMTTVGYGDTSPKSVPGRMFSILWMLLGMVAFSILTANITSSLTHEIESDLNLYGKVVAVLRGSMEKEVAVAYGAGFIEYPDILAMVKALKQEEVNAALLELHSVKTDFYDDNTLEVGRTVDYEYYFGMHIHHVFPNVCTVIRDCVQEIVGGQRFQLETLKLLSGQVVLDTSKNSTHSLFDDLSFFYILIGLFSVLVGGGLLWEYFYYKPRMLRLAKVGTAGNGDAERGGRGTEKSGKAILLQREVEELCENCRARVESIVQTEGPQRLEALQTSDFNPLDGFAIIGNQISSIPGVSSIRKFGSDLPSTVGHLPLRPLKRIAGRSAQGPGAEGAGSSGSK